MLRKSLFIPHEIFNLTIYRGLLSETIWMVLGHFHFFFLRKRRSYGVVVITTAQLHSTKPELSSNPARGVSEIRDGEDI